MDQSSLAGKWIDLLREAAPRIGRIAVVWDRTTGRGQLDFCQAVAHAKGLVTTVVEFGRKTNFEESLKGLGTGQTTGIVHLTSAGFSLLAANFAAAAQKYRLPTISNLKIYAQVGVLMTYGPNQEDYFPRAILLADKIIKGEKPGNLSIEGPDRFELVVNMKTADALGLTIPKSLLLSADEVIR